MKLELMRGLDGRERARLVAVFFVALSVIALEIVTFQTLSFVNDYMVATQVLSVALMGIALGGLLSFFVPRERPDRAMAVVLFLLPLSILVSFPVIIRLNGTPMHMMALMTLPYILASLYISLAFNRLVPGLVYLFDLVGAGLGALVVVFMVPALREEGSFFLLGGISAIPLAVIWLEGWRRGVRTPPLAFLCAGGISVALLVTHVVSDPFNLMWSATGGEEAKGKMFKSWFDRKGEPRWELLYSRGSLIERIDIVRNLKEKRKWLSVYNGRIVDVITPEKSRIGRLDNRMPTHLKMGENPDTLLVGPSGQGLCKAIQALGKGHVDAVEINGAIASLMMKEMYKKSGNAYEGFDLTIGDVRTFVERTDRKYDFVTMLNTHRIWSMGHQGPPEYVHSLEAIEAYLSVLKDDGFMIFEERNINERADLGIRRIVHTAKQALVNFGATEPHKHFAIWELYHGCNKKQWFSEPQRCRRRQLFTFIAIKASPITEDEYNHFQEWAVDLGERKPGKRGDYRGILWRYLPQEPTDHYWTSVVLEDDIYNTPDTDREQHNLSVVTDNVPFPFDVFKKREKPWEIFWNTTILALMMVLLPSVATFLARRKQDQGGIGLARGPARSMINLLLILYFGILGLGYLLIEVVLIQKFGIFLSSPVYSLVVVLGTMLIMSGIGGYFSARFGKRGALAMLALVVVLSAIYWVVLGGLLDALMGLPFALRILAAVVILAPLAFCMGLPFPYGMSLAKEQLSDRHAGLFFGINGGLAAVATPLSIILSMTSGFSTTIFAGGAAYLICLVLVALVGALRKTA